MELLFVKLGGSVLTDKTRPESLNAPVLRTVAELLAAALAARPELRLVLGHGGGSFGHYWAERYNTAAGVSGPESWQGMARVVDAMARLNRAVVATLLAAGLAAVGMQPSASARASGGQLVDMASAPLATLLAAGLTPVVYGDAVLDDRQGCAILSTEAIFGWLAGRLHPSRLILVGEAAVFSADPRRDPAARPIPLIDEHNYAAIVTSLGGSHGVDVTGGMRAKVAAMWALAGELPGLHIQIVGPTAQGLGAALAGQPPLLGTTIRRALPM